MVILSIVSAAMLFGFFSAPGQQGTSWSPEQWAFLCASIITSVGGAVAAVIAARRTANVHNAIRLPSNGIDIGDLMEAMGHVQHLQGNIISEALNPNEPNPPEIPSAAEIARELRKFKGHPRAKDKWAK